MERVLQEQGFDFCYDKRLYDRLAHDSLESVREHLQADAGYREGWRKPIPLERPGVRMSRPTAIYARSTGLGCAP